MGDGWFNDDWGVADWGRNRNAILTFRTKPQYLLPVPKAKGWDLLLICQRIYKIDYDISIKHWKAYPLLESLNRSIKPVVIITLYGSWETSSYRWYRPHIDAIIEEGNFTLLHDLFSQDVVRHI